LRVDDYREKGDDVMSKDLQVETVDISKLKHDPENARKHSDRQISMIEGSLREFGQRRPLICLPDYTVVAGNGTLKAARRLGWKAVSVTILPFSERDKVRAFAIADNRASDLADWDEDILLEALAEIDGSGLLEAAGYYDTELDDLRALLDENDDETILTKMNEERRDSVADMAARYEDRATRQVVLVYPLEVYSWIVDKLAQIRVESDLDTNAHAVAHIIANFTKEETPQWNTES
jgi:ParB-like chromosome segregation protein Spo0J